MLSQSSKITARRHRGAVGQVLVLICAVPMMTLFGFALSRDAEGAKQDVPEPVVTYIELSAREASEEEQARVEEVNGGPVREGILTSETDDPSGRQVVWVGVSDSAAFHQSLAPQVVSDVVIFVIDERGDAMPISEEAFAELQAEMPVELVPIPGGTALLGRATGQELAEGSHCKSTFTSLGVTYYLEAIVTISAYNSGYTSHSCRYSLLS